MRAMLLFRGLGRRLVLAGLLSVVSVVPALAQYPTIIQYTAVQTALNMTPISATAAVNVSTVLTIPAPVGNLYNYVCSLAAELSSDATGGAVTNVASTSTNFGSFAVTISRPATANIDSGSIMYISGGTPATGCVKSTAPGTATVFTSPTGLTHIAWTWMATYFQAP